MATDFGTGMEVNVTNTIIDLVFQQLKDVMESEENLQLLNTDFTRMDVSLRHIHSQFEAQHKKLPEPVEKCLETIKDALGKATALIDRANRQRRQCLGCCLLCNPKLSTQIKQWKTRFGQLFQQLESALSIAASTQQIVESAQPQVEVLLQPLPDSGFVGSGIETARTKLQTWLNEPHPQARVIGVYGMAGVGKTALLKLIYNIYQKEVSGIFDLVIWFTVSQNCTIEQLQLSVADTFNLDLKAISNIDTRKMKLSASLEKKRFLLILDDLWSSIDLNEVGVKFGEHNASKVLISSRSRDVIGTMAANEFSMRMQLLSTEEGWELFRRRAFKNGALPEKNLEDVAMQIASECKGLPLAINTVAAALTWKTTVDEWSRALILMRNVDPSFLSIHRTIDAELYQRLRWSYDDLSNVLKMCFLYCAAFPEDVEIDVETLVEMCTTENFVNPKGTTYFMDVGREYIDVLVDRCLIEYIDAKKEQVKIHDVLRDMAIFIGQGQENWLFLASQHLQNFPGEEEVSHCRRISLCKNNIHVLPTHLKCSKLLSLVLVNNNIDEIPERCFVNTMSLKVLDLSHTSIQSLPISVGQLGQLEFLSLKGCSRLKNLPESICDLSCLQILNLTESGINSLPNRIGELKKNLKHLKFYANNIVKVVPHHISQLSSLNKLVLPRNSIAMSVEDITNLSNLIELDVVIKPDFKVGSISTWLEMRKLTLHFNYDAYPNRDDVPLDIIPLQNLKNLQSLHLEYYQGVNLPNCICQFQNLKNLILSECTRLKYLPTLEIGSDTATGFPMLETLELSFLDNLESMGGPSCLWNEGMMSELQILKIYHCSVLKILGMEKLPKLRQLSISHSDELRELSIGPMLETLDVSWLCNLESIAVPSNVWNEGTIPKLHLLKIIKCPLFKRLSSEKFSNLIQIWIIDCNELRELDVVSFPKLESLTLAHLKKLQSIAVLSNIWNERTMSKLQYLKVVKCPLLKKLPMGMDKLSNLREIVGELNWWEGIIWEDDHMKNKLSQLFKELTT